MTGNYPDPLGHRMAYDADGTVGFWYWESNNIITLLTAAQMLQLNDENTSGVQFSGGGNFNIGFVFPELRDIVGYFYYDSGVQNVQNLYTSVDTTNGYDGTWTSRANPWIKSSSPSPGYRTDRQALNIPGVKSIKFQCNRVNSGAFDDPNPRQLHLYGQPTATTLDRLAIWDASLNQRVNPVYLDWGNVPRSSSADKQFRVKNQSATLTAQSVVINAEAITDTTPSVPGQHLFSTDGTNFSASVNIGDLAPTAISGTITMRRITPSTAALLVWTMRVKAAATSWV